MIPTNHDGLQLWGGTKDQVGGTKLTIELPADLAMLDSKLIDGVVERLFDRLGQCEIVVRVGFPAPFPAYSTHCLHS